MKASDKYPTPPTVGASVIVPVDTFEAMKRELDELSPKEPDKVWPQDGDLYQYIDEYGDTCGSRYVGDSTDEHNRGTGNCHRNAREAEAYGAWLASPITQARRRIEGLAGYSAKGDWAIITTKSRSPIMSVAEGTLYARGGLAFDTEAQAEAALSTHEADIRLVLTGES